MFTLDSESSLQAAFRPKDAKLFEPAPAVTYPLFVRDYLAWVHPAGGRVFLVFSAGGPPIGIVFDTNGGSGPAVPAMCDWCHCMSAGTGVALLSARVNAKKRVGVHACADLSCQKKLEEEADRSGRSVVPAMAALMERIGRFAHEALGIDLQRAP